MATVATTSVVEIPWGYNMEQVKCFQATVPAANASDTLTVTLPAEWRTLIQNGWTLLAEPTIEQFLSADTVGSRTKTAIPIASYSWVENTGVISIVLAATPVSPTNYTARVKLIIGIDV